MAFSSTRDTFQIGNKLMAVGTYTNSAAADTGGTIETGLNDVQYFDYSQTDATGARSPNARISISGGTITITFHGVSAATSGNWFAIGT